MGADPVCGGDGSQIMCTGQTEPEWRLQPSVLIICHTDEEIRTEKALGKLEERFLLRI